MSEEKIQKIEVGGFLFQDKELAEKARREQEGIRYMKGRTNMGKPQLVLKLYDNIIEQELCQTPIGIGYLRELQDYLTASPAVRAKRRYDELKEKGMACNLEEIEQDIIERDYRDMHREHSPLVQAEDAVLVDSSSMTVDQVIEAIIQIARGKGLDIG